MRVKIADRSERSGTRMVERLEFGLVHVDPDLLVRLQKYRRLQTVPQAVKDVAQQMAALAETLLEPRGWLWRGPITRVEDNGRVLVGHRLQFQSQTLARMMTDAAETAIIVLTIGAGLERRAHELVGEEQYVEGLLLDTAGWAALDVLIKETRRRLAGDARARGCRLTARTAPGFADWGLEQQGMLFSAFDGADLTVRLNEAQVMLPRKSISGVYGLIPNSRP